MVRNLYGTVPVGEIARRVGKSVRAVYFQAHEHRITERMLDAPDPLPDGPARAWWRERERRVERLTARAATRVDLWEEVLV